LMTSVTEFLPEIHLANFVNLSTIRVEPTHSFAAKDGRHAA
jgi:hypothetical protein